MSSLTTISVITENYPKAKNCWEIDLDADTEGVPEELVIAFKKIYNNAVHDLVGAVAGKVGWELSKLGSGEIDRKDFDEKISAIQATLTND
jgi:hypothetical protein